MEKGPFSAPCVSLRQPWASIGKHMCYLHRSVALFMLYTRFQSPRGVSGVSTRQLFVGMRGMAETKGPFAGSRPHPKHCTAAEVPRTRCEASSSGARQRAVVPTKQVRRHSIFVSHRRPVFCVQCADTIAASIHFPHPSIVDNGRTQIRNWS